MSDHFLTSFSNETNWTETNLHLNMPTNRYPIILWTHSEQIHFLNTFFYSTDGEKTFPV